MLGGSAGNTVNSDRNLTVGSNGSDRGGSRKTNIWDPQFWADPVSDGATSKWLLPSTSTSSLPITCGSGLLAPRTGSVLVGSSAPNSPKLKPRSSLPTSGLSSGALLSAPTCIQTTTGVARLGPTTTTTVTTTNGVPAQRRRNSCAPAVLMPAAGSRAGSEIDRARHCTSSGVSLKKVDQLPRPPMDTIQLPQDLGRRRSFSSLTAVALELEGGDSREAGSVSVLERGNGAQDSVQRGHVLGDLVTVTTTTPYLHLEPSTPTTPTKATQFIVPAPSMSHTLAMHALHTPRSRGSVSGGHSSRSGVSRTRSPSPSPLSRQIDIGSLESPQEEKSGFFEGRDARVAYLSPPLPPPASRNSRHSFSHGNSGSERANMHLSTTVISAPMPHHPRAQTLPHSLSDQQMNHTQRALSRTPPRPPSTSTSSTSINPPVTPSPPRSITPSPTSLSTPPSPGRKFAPGTKVGRFTLVQERCTKHVDLLKEQQAQRRASLGELTMIRGSGNRGGSLASTPSSPSSSSLLAREDSAAVLDTAEWIENPMLKPDDNVRVFQRKRSRRILNPNELLPPPPVSY
ncbi:MAG: hypothetical protein J3R72DRAFT_458724 [Linnemannia gamsii]|nr:MAG: hypothetical protein J3R72DRAFT_458724 [Linnemannia gamsii]